MIVRGIVDVDELKRIRSILAEYALIEGRPGQFCVWMEKTDGTEAIWVEIDVHENLVQYLTRSGFFNTDKEPPVY